MDRLRGGLGREQLGRLSRRPLLEALGEEAVRARQHPDLPGAGPGAAADRADGHQAVQASLRRSGPDTEHAQPVHQPGQRLPDLPARHPDHQRPGPQHAQAGAPDRAARSARRLGRDPHRAGAVRQRPGPAAEAPGDLHPAGPARGVARAGHRGGPAAAARPAAGTRHRRRAARAAAGRRRRRPGDGEQDHRRRAHQQADRHRRRALVQPRAGADPPARRSRTRRPRTWPPRSNRWRRA